MKSKNPSGRKVVKAFAFIHRTKLVFVSGGDEKSAVYFGMDGKTYFGRDLKVVPCEITYKSK